MVCELVTDKQEVPLRWGFGGPIIGTAKIDPEELDGVVEVSISDDTFKQLTQPEIIDLSIYTETNKEKNDG